MHFQDMFGMQEILVAHGARELLPRTIELLARSRAQGWAEKMAKAAEYFVEPHDNPYGERITEFCEAVVEDRETEKK
jgi:hypothetical protein